MIITLTGANFSANNIGTLSTWTISRVLGDGATYSGDTYVDKGAALNATVTIASGYELGSAGVTVTMGGNAVTSGVTVDGNTVTIAIPSVTGNVVIKVPTKNTATGEEDSGGSSGDDVITPIGEFTLTSSMLKNQTYSTAMGDWNTSNIHLATDFLALQAGYDVVFDLPDDWNGYVAHVSKTKGVSGAYNNNKTSILSGWVTKGTVSTGASLDKYFIVLQKKSKTAITPSDYESIAGSVQVKKPSARTVTLDSTTINAQKGYEQLNIITMENRLASWFYAVTPGSTVTGTVANGLKAYIISIRDGETEFAVDTEWVSSFNKTYDTSCSIMIVAKKEDNSTFTDTSDWTSPITINIK